MVDFCKLTNPMHFYISDYANTATPNKNPKKKAQKEKKIIRSFVVDVLIVSFLGI